MGKPRAARQQPIVLSSGDEADDQNSPPPKRPRRGTLNSIGEHGHHQDSKASKAPKSNSSRTATQKSPAKSPAKPKPIYKPITSFFSKAPIPQNRQLTPDVERTPVNPPIEEVDDILDTSDEDRRTKRPASLAVRKRGKDALTNHGDASLKGSQKFLRPVPAVAGLRSTSSTSRSADVDLRPWNEKFGPVVLDELAVHKRKVADVRAWLTGVFDGKDRKRLLLLKGPAGSGKTTTMSLLAKELGFEIHEWKNPNAASGSAEGFVSITAQFEDFVGRTGTFGALAFDGPKEIPRQGPTPVRDRQRQLILVEEFPNTFARASSAVQSFRSSILNYLTANTPSATAFFANKFVADQSITPIVMIISETLLSTNTAAADSFTAHRLLGPEILSHPGATVVEFNAIAPTFMTKALELVILKEARKSHRKKSVGPQVIQRLSELGDIRSAVSSLEFLCVRGDEDGDWSGKINSTKKKGSKDIPLTQMEQESLEMVTQRESTLGIFHAVGKIVYNKRISEDPSGTTLPQPPNWFPERRRPKASEVHVDELIDELGTDTQTFIAALHENYVLSCQGADNEETADSIEGCIDALSDADLLSVDRFGTTGFGRRNFQGTTTDSLRQDEMSFNVSARGLLYSLPSPVKRAAPPQGIMGSKAKTVSKGSAYAMYWPTSLRIWRQQEELGGLLDMWTSRVQRGELLTHNPEQSRPVVQGTGGVESWKKSASFAQTQHQHGEAEAPPPILLGSGGSARYEMLLERLPYITRILRKTSMPSPSVASAIREIQKITLFTGSVRSTEEQEDLDEDTGEQEQWATDRPESPVKKRKIGITNRRKKTEDPISAIVTKDVSNLVLSEDDIED